MSLAMPSPPLEGMGALITGGGTGIGLATARALAADGALVTLAGRREDPIRTAAAALGDEGHEARWICCDVTDEDAVAAAVARADEGVGLRIVVASAGTGWLGPVVATPREQWDRVLATNLTGTFLALKHAAPAMARAGGGAFTAISSIAASATHRFLIPYSVAKSGIDALVRNAADELGGSNVRVNAVRPGLVPTDISTGLVATDAVREDYLAQMPISRLGTVEDIAAAVRFLSGPESSWITGVCLAVDGGHHLRRGPDYRPFIRMQHPGDTAETGIP